MNLTEPSVAVLSMAFLLGATLTLVVVTVVAFLWFSRPATIKHLLDGIFRGISLHQPELLVVDIYGSERRLWVNDIRTSFLNDRFPAGRHAMPPDPRVPDFEYEGPVGEEEIATALVAPGALEIVAAAVAPAPPAEPPPRKVPHRSTRTP